VTPVAPGRPRWYETTSMRRRRRTALRAAALPALLGVLGLVDLACSTPVRSDAPLAPAPAWSLPPQCAVPVQRSSPSRSHPAAREAQQRLNTLGYDCGVPDGLIGPKTRECIARFQRDRALPATGILDAETMGAIRGE